MGRETFECEMDDAELEDLLHGRRKEVVFIIDHVEVIVRKFD